MLGMNFLNEIANTYPSAISFAAGRPSTKLLGRLFPERIVRSVLHFEREAGGRHNRFSANLLQYGRTAGIINGIVAQQLHNDEGVTASEELVIITAGCQEALALCVSTLCPAPSDVLLVPNPTYIGALGAALMNGVTPYALPHVNANMAERIENSVRNLREEGRRARLLYLIPNFDNPTGNVIDESERRSILSVCVKHRIVVLEDNPYGMFRFEGSPIRPMSALDSAGSVIYLSTFSKTISPALRVGSITLPESLFGDIAARKHLFDDLVERKSYLTVNTSQLNQAVVGGILLDQKLSLKKWIHPTVVLYRRNRDLLVKLLQRLLPPISPSIHWNNPLGGFFLTLDLPFQFDSDDVRHCATQSGVIVMPMSFFSLDSSQNHRIRLSFSAVDEQQIERGVPALSRYIASRIA